MVRGRGLEPLYSLVFTCSLGNTGWMLSLLRTVIHADIYIALSAFLRRSSPRSTRPPPLFHNRNDAAALAYSLNLVRRHTELAANAPTPMLYARLMQAAIRSGDSFSSCGHRLTTARANCRTRLLRTASACSCVQTSPSLTPSVSPCPIVQIPAGQR